MGLGLRPPAMGTGMTGYGPPGLGQGPPLSALSANGMSFAPQQALPQPQSTGPKLTAFVGSISPGITDNFLTQLLSVSDVLYLMSHHTYLGIEIGLWSAAVLQTHTNSVWKAWCIWICRI